MPIHDLPYAKIEVSDPGNAYASAPYFALPGTPYPTCAVEDCHDDATQIVRISGRYFRGELNGPVPVRICASHRREIEEDWTRLGVDAEPVT